MTATEYNTLIAMCLSLFGLAMLLAACGSASGGSIKPAYETDQSSSEDPCASQGLNLVQEKTNQVTFYKDVLPVLSASTTGRVHKCTVCHAFYSKPSGSNSVDKIERVIDSMESGRMPIEGGDKVSPSEINILKLWRATGFQTGDPADFESDIKLTPDQNRNCNSNQTVK